MKKWKFSSFYLRPRPTVPPAKHIYRGRKFLKNALATSHPTWRRRWPAATTQTQHTLPSTRTGYLIRYVNPELPKMPWATLSRSSCESSTRVGCLFKCYTNLLSTRWAGSFIHCPVDASPRRIILERATCPWGGSLTHLRHIWRATRRLTTSVRALRTRRSLRDWNWYPEWSRNWTGRDWLHWTGLAAPTVFNDNLLSYVFLNIISCCWRAGDDVAITHVAPSHEVVHVDVDVHVTGDSSCNISHQGHSHGISH